MMISIGVIIDSTNKQREKHDNIGYFTYPRLYIVCQFSICGVIVGNNIRVGGVGEGL